MEKIDRKKIFCPILVNAYIRAKEDADSRAPKAEGVKYSIGDYGDLPTFKGGAVGEGTCLVCGKSITVNLQFSKIEGATDSEGNPVTLYTKIGAKESLGVSGTECTRDNLQKQQSLN